MLCLHYWLSVNMSNVLVMLGQEQNEEALMEEIVKVANM